MNEQVTQIARRIKELREVLEMSLEDVSMQLGVCIEDYQRYEEGKDDIPVGVLYGAAALFQVDPTLLLTGKPPKMRTYALVKKGSGLDIERYPGYRFSSLATNYVGREMEPMIVNLDPLALDEPPEYFCHSGQEFNYILKGRIKLILGEHELLLDEGDSVYFDPRMSHVQVAVGGPATFLVVINEQATAYGNPTIMDPRQDREHTFKD